MIAHRCKDCIWWDNRHPSIQDAPIRLRKEHPGFCRKHKPGGLRLELYFYGVQPIMDAEEFCGEFRPDRE